MDEGRFIVTVSGADTHTLDELEDACQQLRDDLADVDDIELSELTTQAPEGVRSGLLAAVSATIVISLLGSRIALLGVQDLKKVKQTVLPALARILSLWLSRNRGVKAVITLPDGTRADLTNTNEDDIRTILEQVTDKPGHHDA